MPTANLQIRYNLTMAWPLAFNALLVQSMLLIDTFLVAPLGELAVAALGIASTLIAFILGVEIAIGNGIQLLVGRAFGSKSQEELAIAYWSGLVINISTSVLFFLILTIFDTHIITAITNNAALIPVTETYLSITKYIVLITAYTQVCTALLNGCGKTRKPLQGFMIELPINAAISYILINGMADYQGLGVEGAAWGSLIAVIIRAAFLHLVLKTDLTINLSYPVNRKLSAEIGPQYLEIYPIAANFLVLSVGATIYHLLFAQLDLYSFVAITLIFPWIRAGTQFPNSWAQASAITISQTLGQKDTQNLSLFVSAATRIGMWISVGVALVFIILSLSVPIIYPNIALQTLSAIIAIASLFIALPIVRAYNTIAGNILRALGQSNLVLKIHFITQWLVALPLCAVLIIYLDASIFWGFAMIPLEEVLKIYWFYRFKKHYVSLANKKREL
ncbi:MATE family efflux transporter [Paraglaciecola sp. 2405UD69-4]|uniref:MATE family efflux transporter n=1 Tax=Paraglaciecola sp. 2405UD69-4 TaxID=3391836 RepID=UPI0039C8E992